MAILERHFDKFVPEPNTGCWIWTAGLSTGRASYPSAGWEGKVVRVTRIICEEAYGPPPSSKHNALHNTANGCIGGLCVNPDHLRWGTQAENMQDISPEERSDRIRRGAAKMTIAARMDRHLKMLAKRWPKRKGGGTWL